MKIGILTLHSQINYGGVLQAYALQKFLSDRGLGAETIDYWFSADNNALTGGVTDQGGFSLHMLIRLLRNFFLNGIVISDIFRRKRTRDFLETHLRKSSQVYKSIQDLQKISGYDLIIVGSDQVWNYKWFGVPNPFLLSFLEDSIPRVSYAASFGFRELPPERLMEYKQGLSRFSRISVRERQSIDLVSQIAGKDPEWSVDPSLLLTREDWSEMVAGKEPTPFLMCYWLGDLDRILKLLLELAKNKKMKVALYGDNKILRNAYGPLVSLLARFVLMIHPRIKCCFSSGPLEFLNSVAKCSGVVTDSFHMMMFACIFGKPFKVFVNSADHRKKMSARLIDFAKQCGLEEGVELEIPTSEITLQDFDFVEIWEEVDAFKKSSVEYLDEVVSTYCLS